MGKTNTHTRSFVVAPEKTVGEESHAKDSLATPFPAGRKFAAGIVKYFPTGRKFRQNPLDNIPCLCASLKESGKGAAGEARAGKDLPACHDVHGNTRT